VKKIIESIQSYSRRLQHKSDGQSVQHSHHERRRETRSPRMSPCTYGLMRSIDRDGVTLEEGCGTAVNDSPGGMRLLLGIAPSKGQCLEIQADDRTLMRAVYLVDVCWTKLLREEAQGALYLVGCRLNFGAVQANAG
jgi:hypothetical protein